MLVQKQTLLSFVHLLAMDRLSFVPTRKTNLPPEFPVDISDRQRKHFKTDAECLGKIKMNSFIEEKSKLGGI